MRIDETIREKLLDYFKGMKKLHISYLETWEKCIRISETVEELMRQKREILINLLNELPIGHTQCYFCLLREYKAAFASCYYCPYAKYHGVCIHRGSDYARISELLKRLKYEISTFYYKGEKYD